MTLSTLADGLLKLRFLVGYTTWLIAGLLLSIVVLARLRNMKNDRRRLYKALLVFCLGLIWSGSWGQMGVWQYGIIMQGLPLSRAVVSIGWSLGVLWLASALGLIVWCVSKEEVKMHQVQPSNGAGILPPAQ